MPILVPVMMYGWIAVTIVLFSKRTAQEAVVMAVIGGFLLLPATSFDLPGLPNYNKITSIAFGLILGGAISGKSREHPFRSGALDLPAFIWCFASPVMTSLSNGLGLYNGVSELVQNTLGWGVVYWAGRKYFTEPADLRVLAKGIALGGLLYFPAVVFEVRMSPQLSNMVYGFFPHSFAQHFRYGGFRPIVFMTHGLMVALWMAIGSTAVFWLWRAKIFGKLASAPAWICSICMVAAVLLCKSANGWVFGVLGIVAYYYFRKTHSLLAFRILYLAIPVYMALRIGNVITASSIESLASSLFDAERIGSLTWRLRQEDLFSAHTLARQWLGWGGFDRNWPVDIYTGEKLIQMVDSFWIIAYSVYGLVGLSSVYLTLGLGPWKVLSFYRRQGRQSVEEMAGSYGLDALLLCAVVAFYMIDTLLNAMLSPIYLLCSGALASHYVFCRQRETAAVNSQALSLRPAVAGGIDEK